MQKKFESIVDKRLCTNNIFLILQQTKFNRNQQFLKAYFASKLNLYKSKRKSLNQIWPNIRL